jgi:hypothetical protein
MNEFLEVSPAYGRSYKNAAEVQAGWDAGHDFFSHTHGAYMSQRDHEAMGSPQVTVRYGGKSAAQATKFYNIKKKKATPKDAYGQEVDPNKRSLRDYNDVDLSGVVPGATAAARKAKRAAEGK